MRDDTPSRTAAWVAAARHLGQLLPDAVRLADDPYGAIFTSQRLADLIHRASPRGSAGSATDRDADAAASARGLTMSINKALRAIRHPLTRIPGVRSWIVYMQVRTRVIDDALRAFVERHAHDSLRPQLLVLGAGYDCRALRMPELDDVRVFEVDHPATQGHKRAVFDRYGIATPATFVTWDFEQRPVSDLPEALLAYGFDHAAPTFTIWEGVTMYLTEPAIDASLRAIAEWSAPGSELAMTYFAKSHLAKPSLATRVIQAAVATVGEPWRWGWKPEELPGYLAARGLELVDDISLADAARVLLPPELAAYVGGPDRRVAVAAAESIAVARHDG